MFKFIRNILATIYYLILNAIQYKELLKGEGVGVYKRKQILMSYFKLRFKQDILVEKFGRKNDLSNAVFLGKKFSIGNDLISFIYLIKEIFIDHCYYFKTDNDNVVVFDCGSNLGLSIFYFQSLFGERLKIYGFEASPQTFAFLFNNVNSFKCDAEIQIHNKCLDEDTGNEIGFYSIDGEYCGIGNTMVGDVKLTNRDYKKKKIILKTDVLSKYITSDIDCLKLDVEGAELRVLKDLDKNIILKYISKIVLEYHFHLNSDDNNGLGGLLEILERNNFKYSIDSNLNGINRFVNQNTLMIYAFKK